jgi:DNA-binding transcriptional MocR family regulator
VKLPTALIGGPARELQAYAALASYDWDGRGCWASLETLAADMGCSIDTVERAIAGLVEKGWVKKIRRGGRLTNRYAVRDAIDSASVPRHDSATVRTRDSAPVRHEVEDIEVETEKKNPEMPVHLSVHLGRRRIEDLKALCRLVESLTDRDTDTLKHFVLDELPRHGARDFAHALDRLLHAREHGLGDTREPIRSEAAYARHVLHRIEDHWEWS